jgi:hypothetical protein
VARPSSDDLWLFHPIVRRRGGSAITTVDRNQLEEPIDAGDALARRALDVASAELVSVPVVTHVYSVAVLLRLRFARLPTSDRGREAAREAWRLNLAILGAAALCLGSVVAVWVVGN